MQHWTTKKQCHRQLKTWKLLRPFRQDAGVCAFMKCLKITLPKTNIAPTNGWLEYYFPIGEVYFLGQKVSFREGIWLFNPDNPPLCSACFLSLIPSHGVEKKHEMRQIGPSSSSNLTGWLIKRGLKSKKKTASLNIPNQGQFERIPYIINILLLYKYHFFKVQPGNVLLVKVWWFIFLLAVPGVLLIQFFLEPIQGQFVYPPWN